VAAVLAHETAEGQVARVSSGASGVDDSAALVRLFLAHRDPDVFAQLVDRHQQRVFRLVCSVLGPAHAANGEAEEVTQEVFLRVFRQLDTYRGDAAFSSWVYRIAFRCAIDVKRLARVSRPHGVVMPSIAAPEAQDRDQDADVRRAVDQLPGLYRTLMHMYYWMECPVDEIAETLEMPAGTVKSYLARARQMVKTKLREDNDDANPRR
jgi:RNA polymerase sigma-70 factor, ECF subfamily